jgi:hypothetical protein
VRVLVSFAGGVGAVVVVGGWSRSISMVGGCVVVFWLWFGLGVVFGGDVLGWWRVGPLQAVFF